MAKVGTRVTLSQEEAHEILDILNSIIEDEDCFKEEMGEQNCLHCQINRAAGCLFSGGLMENYRRP